MLHIIGPKYPVPEGAEVINTTSRSDTWSRGLSPFFLGPVDLYDGYRSINVENAWQFSKVFEYYLEEDESVGERYFRWAQEGWNSIKAHRYPMGRDAKPLFSAIPLIVLLTVTILIDVVTIILYKKRMLQIKLCILNIVLLLGLQGLLYYYISVTSHQLGFNPTYSLIFIFPTISAILTYLALRGVAKDEKLIRSMDRLR
jgi:hypothetical protein